MIYDVFSKEFSGSLLLRLAEVEPEKGLIALLAGFSEPTASRFLHISSYTVLRC
jgi:hypothetical protein